MTEPCKHEWVPEDKENPFRVNKMLGGGLLAYVICEKCGARTWLTEEQYAALEI